MLDGRVEKNALHAHRRIQLGRSRSASLDDMMPSYPEIFDASQHIRYYDRACPLNGVWGPAVFSE